MPVVVLQTVPGRPLIPNLANLTVQQRQAILAQQQRFMVTSDAARRMLVRPPTSGIILPPGRVLLTNNGPASLLPGVAGRPAGVAAVTTSSAGGVLLTVAPTAVAHRPEKRKYDALRSESHYHSTRSICIIIQQCITLCCAFGVCWTGLQWFVWRPSGD